MPDPMPPSPSEGENPFRSPKPTDSGSSILGGASGESIRNSGKFVRHVPIVAWLMIANSVLLAIGGVFLVGMAVMFQFIPMEEEEVFDGSFWNWMTGMYAGIGILVLLVAVIQLVAGIKNLDYRGQTLGIVALITGIMMIFTCYCAPTSIGLAIYGLIIYLNPEVSEAFQLRSTGLSREDVLARMNV